MRKKSLLILLGALFLLADLVISLLFITGKSPIGLLGLSSPKITITPFPTLVVENTANINNSATVNQTTFPSAQPNNFNVYAVDLIPQNLSAGQAMELSCSYSSDTQSKGDADLFLLDIKNQSFLVKNLPSLTIEKGNNKIKVSASNTNLIPNGQYKAILNISDQNSHQVMANCVSKTFSFTNNNSFVLSGLESAKNNLVVQLGNTKSLNFYLHGFGNFSNLKARVVVKDIILKDSKVYYVKDLAPISLNNKEDKTISVDLSDFPLSGSFFINLELQDQKRNLVSSSPLQAFYAGIVPQISKVSTVAQGTSGYNINIVYDGQEQRADNGLEMYAVVCNSSDCDFSNWTDLGSGWPPSLFIVGKTWSLNKNKITIKVRLKDTFGDLFNYHN